MSELPPEQSLSGSQSSEGKLTPQERRAQREARKRERQAMKAEGRKQKQEKAQRFEDTRHGTSKVKANQQHHINLPPKGAIASHKRARHRPPPSNFFNRFEPNNPNSQG